MEETKQNKHFKAAVWIPITKCAQAQSLQLRNTLKSWDMEGLNATNLEGIPVLHEPLM